MSVQDGKIDGWFDMTDGAVTLATPRGAAATPWHEGYMEAQSAGGRNENPWIELTPQWWEWDRGFDAGREDFNQRV